MNKKIKLLILLILTILLFLLIPQNANAALQANPNTNYGKKDTPTNWILNFRKMETEGEAMGLSENIDEKTLLPTKESGSNNIDVHMMKSTEYGAIAILSASGYGNSQSVQSSSMKTTTGNETGIHFEGSDWELIAGGLQGSIFGGVDPRYYDTYGGNYTSKRVGDALGAKGTAYPGCANWHGASNANWVRSDHPYCVRGIANYGGLFSFGGSTGSLILYARSVVACGTGL